MRTVGRETGLDRGSVLIAVDRRIGVVRRQIRPVPCCDGYSDEPSVRRPGGVGSASGWALSPGKRGTIRRFEGRRKLRNSGDSIDHRMQSAARRQGQGVVNTDRDRQSRNGRQSRQRRRNGDRQAARGQRGTNRTPRLERRYHDQAERSLAMPHKGSLTSPAPAPGGPLVVHGCPAPRLERAILRWGRIGLIVAAVIAAFGGAGYVLALAIGVLAGAVAALAAGLQALGGALILCAIGVFLLLALGAKK